MDTTTIASLASYIPTSGVSQRVGIAVLNKALDIQATNALALIQALPQPARVNLPAHLGQNIDTTA